MFLDSTVHNFRKFLPILTCEMEGTTKTVVIDLANSEYHTY